MYGPLEVIGEGDQLDPHVEQLVSRPKNVRRAVWDQRGRSFRLTADAVVRQTGEVLRLEVQYHGRRGSQIQVSLVRRDGSVLRLWHHHPNAHVNPDGNLVGPTHTHFPTLGHPIDMINHQGRSTWAFPTYDMNPEEIRSVLVWFAQHCNISDLQLPNYPRG